MGSFVFSTMMVGLLSEGDLKRKLNTLVFKACFRMLSRGFSGVIRFYNKENRPKCDGICVANHTTPIDAAVLANDCCFSFVSFLVNKIYLLGISLC